jgi:hypothetical protein
LSRLRAAQDEVCGERIERLALFASPHKRRRAGGLRTTSWRSFPKTFLDSASKPGQSSTPGARGWGPGLGNSLRY